MNHDWKTTKTVDGRVEMAALLRTLLLFQIPIHIAQPQIALNRFTTCSAWYGEIRCWGTDLESGEIVLDTSNQQPPDDFYVVGDDFITKKLIARYEHYCALSYSGKVRCWGSGKNGQLGYGNTDDISFGSTLTDVVCLSLFAESMLIVQEK